MATTLGSGPSAEAETGRSEDAAGRRYDGVVYSTELVSEAVRPSPVFYLIVVLTVVTGWLTTTDLISSGVAVFLFILAAWTLSLIFHEFAHAFVAWRSGDRSIVQRGYLTLDPRKYTHPILSLVLPVVFIMMGGIALPGGAVMINRAALNNAQATLVALAGPFTNLVFGSVSLLAIANGIVDATTQPTLTRAVAFFGFLQIIVFVLNMLPIPGLDGYAAIEPALPESTQQLMRPVRNYAFMILIVLLFYVEWAQRLFWGLVLVVLDVFSIDNQLIQDGLDLFRFWGDLSVF